jgi:TolB-like protein
MACVASPAVAQPSALQKAKEEYQFAEYDKAIELFSEVAQDESNSEAVRKEALRYLGRSYIAKNSKDQARDAIRRLISMEPPLVELDPDVEPPTVMDLYYDVRSDMQGDYRVQTDPGIQTLAIIDFTNSSIDENERWEGLRNGLPAMAINVLNNGTDLKVIERERIEWLLNEIELQRQADVVDQSTAVRTGKLLGANAVVFGSYLVYDEQMIINARVVKVETGEILLGDQVQGEPQNFFDLIQELGTKIARSLNTELEENKADMEQTNSLDAMMAYSDGLGLMEDGDYQAAYEKFQKAVDYDPDFRRAERKAESLRPMLAAAGTQGSEASSSSMNR